MNKGRGIHIGILLILSILVFCRTLGRGENGEGQTDATQPGVKLKVNPSYLSALKWRCVGPHRGGRVTAVAGDPSDLMVFYFGATGGGVWKTTDGGQTWKNISDGFFKTGSVGAIEVAASDPNIIYVGMGECPIRGDVSHGDGVYKSIDGGSTWKNMGLQDTRHIARVRIHPKNPDLVYVAALGHVFGPHPERGVYRSKDGGKTWEKVLFRSNKAGAIDLSMNPTNPRILYAAFWEARRYPWGLHSSGPDSSIYRTTDGGDTWVELTDNPGLPKGMKDRIGIAVSPAKPERIWAIIVAESEKGIYRSDDHGDTWKRVSDNPNLFVRPWYFNHIHADTQNPEVVYVLNTGFWKSTDGGRTYVNRHTPHSDNHDLWIDPKNARRMIEGNDGGATVTFNGGETWSTLYNQPTAQIYHVTTDNQFPYRIYGAQQDNSTISIPSRSRYGSITAVEWYPVGGGEAGYIAVHPNNPNIIFAADHHWLTRYDHRTGQRKFISPWPENHYGWGAREMKYRFQWTHPVLLSPHNPEVLYTTAQVVFKSTNQGHSWEIISPDLTRADPTTLEVTPRWGKKLPDYQPQYWGPVVRDNTGVEWYATIFAFAESPLAKGLLWAGSDDGLIHISRNGGRTWENVTPKKIPEFSLISIIEPSPHNPGTAYVAATRYKLDDYKPYLYRSTDYGKTWTKITRGIRAGDFTRVIREDPVRRGLLYAGTETGIYVSFDDGQTWQPLQLNLPAVPVHDLVVKDNDLIAATHGRGFWVLDNITLLRQVNEKIMKSTFYLFKPQTTVRFRQNTRDVIRPVQDWPSAEALNPPNGVIIDFYLKEIPDEELSLTILDEKGQVIRSFKGFEEGKEPRAEKVTVPVVIAGKGSGRELLPEKDTIQVRVGANRFVWNLRYPGPRRVPGAVFRRGIPRGPLAPPGTYQAKLTAGNETLIQRFEIVKDPRLAATQENFDQQFSLLIQIRDKISETHDAVNTIRSIRQQLEKMVKITEKTPSNQKIVSAAKSIDNKLWPVEDELIQFRAKVRRDLIAHPVMLNDKFYSLATFVEEADGRPTEQDFELFEDLCDRLKKALSKLGDIIQKDLEGFNKIASDANLPRVIVKDSPSLE